MNKWKKMLALVCVVLALGAVLGAALWLHVRSADYPAESKNGVAMGTVVSMKLYDEEMPQLSSRVLELIDTLENTISWRRQNSPVAQLNRTGACENELVADVVQRCAPIAAKTDGAFALTVGRVSTLWDFGGENERLPSSSELQAALPFVDDTKLRVSGNIVTAEKGQQLDLGAVGKGLACDTVRAYLEKAGVKGGVISVGGSICAFGSRNKAGDPWRVAIRHPRQSDALLGVITLDEGFVSTSGDYEKTFEQNGKRYHHLLDARTGYPAENGLCSVTVVCDNGMLSDALSTACFLLGEAASKPLLDSYDAAAIFVTTDGAISTYGDVKFTAYES